MNRRSFLRALGLGAGAVALAPILPAVSPALGYAAQKNIYGRVGTTGPMVRAAQKDAFSRAIEQELMAIARDIQRQEEGFLVRGAASSL